MDGMNGTLLFLIFPLVKCCISRVLDSEIFPFPWLSLVASNVDDKTLFDWLGNA